MNSGLPPHTIRISARARYPQIRILPPDRIEVVLPAGMSVAAAAELVANKRVWIRRKLAHFAELKAAHAMPVADKVPTHPEHIHLPAIDRQFSIAYRPAGGRGVRTTHQEDVLTLSGAVDDPQRVRTALKRWLLATARAELPPMLHALADGNGFDFRQATVRFQKTRWGSCSSQRHIILNARLLCLPSELARHVMLHELAHLRYLNHSRPFWNLLHRLDPDTQQHHAALRAAWLHMPAWLEAG